MVHNLADINYKTVSCTLKYRVVINLNHLLCNLLKFAIKCAILKKWKNDCCHKLVFTLVPTLFLDHFWVYYLIFLQSWSTFDIA